MAGTSYKAAVFTGPGNPFELQTFEAPEHLAPGSALCRIRLSTICGSDLHTMAGRRQEPAPAILGHETVGELIALGPGPLRDASGAELSVGDRVTWDIVVSCGECFYCKRDLPQKCTSLLKYGHMSCQDAPHLTSGYAQAVVLLPGTAIFRVPDQIPDTLAAPANCVTATACNAMEAVGLLLGETVLIQGAGMLGLNLIALAKEAGASCVVVTDGNELRLDLARAFGADLTVDVRTTSDEEAVGLIREASGGFGVDAAIEVCGVASALNVGMQALRMGGRYVIAGMVVPGVELPVQAHEVLRRCLTIRGIHNYRPEHLGQALEFLERFGERYPYGELVGAEFALREINEAMKVAASGRFVRVGVAP
jgi:putative phosphonate catabolism associated alcohol dehydrogenase